MSISKLHYVLMGLSLVILAEVIWMGNFFQNQTQATVVAEQLPQELIEIAAGEAAAVEQISSKSHSGNALWLFPLNTNQIAIYLSLQKPAKLVHAQLRFDPQETRILDAVPTLAGTQVAYGELKTYLLNQVDAELGQISLLVQLSASDSGKLLLGTVAVASGSAQPSIRYLPQSQEASYLLGENNQLVDLQIGVNK